MIIGLSGRAGAGKDTVAGELIKLYEFERLAFADHLKKVAADLMGWPLDLFYDRDRKEVEVEGWPGLTPRIVAQKLGTEVGRNIAPDVWVRRTLDKAKMFPRVVITDVRFPNEAEAIKAYGGWMVRVEREGLPDVAPHPSETALDVHDFDYVLYNNGGLDMLTHLVNVMARRLIRPFPDVIQRQSGGTSSWWYNQTE
jgi:hypothetical protein